MTFYKKRGKRKSKSQNLRWHAKRRAFERYGINLNHKLLNSIKKRIKTKNAVFIKRHSLRVTEWEVEVASKNVRLLYDSIHHEVVTCLTPKKSSQNNSPG